MASRSARISFRCWYCNRGFLVEASRVREVMRCGCGQRVRVPRHSGGRSRYRSVTDWLVEGLVYGSGGAMLGLALGMALASQFLVIPVPGVRRRFLAAVMAAGFLAGLFGGEPVVNWLGRTLRERSEH